MEKNNFIYFGTPSVSADTLERLIAHGLTPSLVVTAEDAPRGRGLVLTPSETNVLAKTNGIPVLTPAKLDEATVETIARYEADYALVVAYGKIFPETLIAQFPKGVLNVHYSLLPKYRGATPLEGALLAGETETGVTVQKMVKELDAGDVVAQVATAILATETARELRPRLIQMGAELLVQTLPSYLSGELPGMAQDAALATRSGKLKKEDGLLDLTAPAEKNWNKYRAYADTIGTYFFKEDKRMKVTAAALKNNVFTIERVIPEGKNEMPYVI